MATKTAKKTEGVTFRLPQDMLNKLKEEADQKQISTNTLATQVFRQHQDWSSTAGKALLVSFPRKLLVMLMDGYTEEQISKFAEHIAKKEVKDIILLMRDTYQLEAFLDVVESWARASGFAMKKNVEGKTYSFIIQHDMSKKWSYYLAELFNHIFEELAGKRPTSTITDNTIAFKIEG